MFNLPDVEIGRTVVNTFIALMLLVIWMYDQPIANIFAPIRKMMEKTIKWSGLWHGWSMFAPGPSYINRRLAAEFLLTDGEIIEYPIWDFGTLGKLDAVVKGRHRKLRERVLEKSYNIIKPSYCHFLVQQFYRDQLKKQGVVLDRVVKVWLYDCSSRIPDPGADVDDHYFYKSWFFTYEVPENLEAELNQYK